jgi:hypothetical protein
MRRLRLPSAAGVMLLLGLLVAAPAAAQPDHLHADLALVGCGTLQATGFNLPASTRLDLRFENAASGAALHTAAVTTKADGSLVVKAEVPLTGVTSVRMEIERPGAAKPFAFSEMTLAGPCPLPFTGPARAPGLLGLALAMLVAGSVLVRMSANRGRHRAPRP